MVEFAVAVQSAQELSLAKEPWVANSCQNEIEAELQNVFFQEWTDLFGEMVQPHRIYFGSEFCQYRLVSLAAVKKALNYSWDNGFEFTFVTPFTHNDKFLQLVKVLSYLDQMVQSSGKKIEVVVNDWGVYHHIQTHFPHLDVVIGRLLNKTIRDPRVAHYYDDERAPERARKFFKETGLFSSWFAKFLENGNVVGVEFDQLIQGNDLSVKEWEASLFVSFHFPFGCVASGSACMVGFMETEKESKFRGDPKCKQQCQLYVFELKNRQHTDMQHRVFQKGTTVFYAHNSELVKKGLKGLQTIERPRVVYSPRIPM